MLADLRERGDGAAVLFDGNDTVRAQGQQSAGQATRTGTDLDHFRSIQRAR